MIAVASRQGDAAAEGIERRAIVAGRWSLAEAASQQTHVGTSGTHTNRDHARPLGTYALRLPQRVRSGGLRTGRRSEREGGGR
jgi:hypothetical protein